MRQLTDLLHDDWGSPKKGTYPSPCQVIENLTYDYSEKSGVDSRAKSRFMVLVHFPNQKYREITHVQEYDVESMVGNIGGYIGLFLGYTLLHFPRFMLSVFAYIKNKFFPRISHIRRNKVSTKPLERKMSHNIKEKHTLCFDSCNSNNDIILVDVEGQLTALKERIVEVERQVSVIQERRQGRFSKSSNRVLRSAGSCSCACSSSSLYKVRVKEWNNSVNTPVLCENKIIA